MYPRLNGKAINFSKNSRKIYFRSKFLGQVKLKDWSLNYKYNSMYNNLNF